MTTRSFFCLSREGVITDLKNCWLVLREIADVDRTYLKSELCFFCFLLSCNFNFIFHRKLLSCDFNFIYVEVKSLKRP